MAEMELFAFDAVLFGPREIGLAVIPLAVSVTAVVAWLPGSPLKSHLASSSAPAVSELPIARMAVPRIL